MDGQTPNQDTAARLKSDWRASPFSRNQLSGLQLVGYMNCSVGCIYYVRSCGGGKSIRKGGKREDVGAVWVSFSACDKTVSFFWIEGAFRSSRWSSASTRHSTRLALPQHVHTCAGKSVHYLLLPCSDHEEFASFQQR